MRAALLEASEKPLTIVDDIDIQDGQVKGVRLASGEYIESDHVVLAVGHSARDTFQMLYERGYRPVTVAELVDGAIDLPAGTSPVVFTFDDSSPSQFRYIERDGQLEIDPTSAVGIWLDFAKTKPDWGNKAVFCMLSGAEAGRSFFGNKGIEGQRSEWRFQKVRFLAEQGFELCNHTLWHANLAKYDDARVQEQIARGVMAIDSAVPGYRVRSFALPLGVWPVNRGLAKTGSWTDPRTKRVVRYDFDAILEVAGVPNPAPGTPHFDPLSLDRLQIGVARSPVHDRRELRLQMHRTIR